VGELKQKVATSALTAKKRCRVGSKNISMGSHGGMKLWQGGQRQELIFHNLRGVGKEELKTT